MKKQFLYLLALIVVIGIGCQKELSFELGDSPAEGSLQSDVSGDCLPKTVNGIYISGTPLVSTSNTITVSVNVTKTGTYTIGTDTVNGYYFRGIGTFTSLGVNTVTLRGNGTPFAQGTNNFVVSFNGTVCDIQINVLPVGSGPATFTLAGAPAACTTPVISGTYVKGGPLGAGNTVVLKVNVTVAGTYNVSTAPAVNGMTFAGSGSLATGAQTITLTGTGTPTTSGPNTINVTVGATTCSFVITVVDPVTGSLGGGPGACTPVTPNGTYTINVPLTAANTIQVQITTAAIGPYSVSTNTVAGISFAGSGTSTGATQLILLTGTGTPTASGPQNFTVSFGTSTCTFTLTIGAGAQYTADCSSASENGTYEVGTALNGTNTVDIDVNVTSLGAYSISTTSTNGMVFSASGTFTVLGAQTITLTGSGTPAAAGITNIPMPGLTPCTFPITVDPAPVIEWKFTVGTTTYQGSTDLAQVIPLGPFSSFAYGGSNGGGNTILFLLVDVSGTISNSETYKANATTLPPANSATFQFDDGAGVTYAADNTNGTGLTFTVTNHNTVAKTMTGTFSGTVKDAANVTKTITNGTFTATYL
jgi:hypothetical protein